MRDLVGYGRDRPTTSWPNEARIAVSLAVHFEEGAEPGPLEGDDFTEGADPESTTEGAVSEGNRRDLQVESLWEYGPRRGLWRLLDIFDRHAVKVTFFCAGQALEKNPVAGAEVFARGHEICAHGYRFVRSPSLSPAEEEADIDRAIRAVRAITGQAPAGWLSRAPSTRTRVLLVAKGSFIYDSDSYADDLPYFVEADGRSFLTIPYTIDVNDRRFWAAAGLPGFTRPQDFFAVMKSAFDRLYVEGATHPQMMSVGMHLRISGRPSRARQVEHFLRYARGFPGVWFARRVDIAEWWLQSHGQSM